MLSFDLSYNSTSSNPIISSNLPLLQVPLIPLPPRTLTPPCPTHLWYSTPPLLDSQAAAPGYPTVEPRLSATPYPLPSSRTHTLLLHQWTDSTVVEFNPGLLSRSQWWLQSACITGPWPLPPLSYLLHQWLCSLGKAHTLPSRHKSIPPTWELIQLSP